MKAWERKLLRLIYEHRNDDDFVKCVEQLCNEYTVSYTKVHNFLKVMSEGAKELATTNELQAI